MSESSPVEKMTPVLRRQLQQAYERGVSLTAQKEYDFDHATALFIECVVRDPGNLLYVEAFLKNLQRKYGNNRKGGSLKLFGGRGAFKRAAARGNWAEVLRLGPAVLKNNPWDAAALCAMASACEACDFPEVELRYLRNAQEAHPDDIEVNRHHAKALARSGHFDEAIGCWRRVQAAAANDQEAKRAISQLISAKTESWSTQGENKPPPLTDEEKNRPQRRIPLTRRQELEQEVLRRPGNPQSYFDLADHLIKEEEYRDALRVLNKALAASGNDLAVRERLEDTMILEAVHRAKIAEKRADEELTEEANRLAQQLRSDLNRLELEIYQNRCERYPQEVTHKLKLGICLKRAGNFREAVKLLDLAVEQDLQNSRAMLELGETKQHLKQYAEALKCYRKTLELAKNEGKHESYKLALYRAGVLAAGLKEPASAEGYFRELLEIDPQYKDVADRLDKIAEIRDKERFDET